MLKKGIGYSSIYLHHRVGGNNPLCFTLVVTIEVDYTAEADVLIMN